MLVLRRISSLRFVSLPLYRHQPRPLPLPLSLPPLSFRRSFAANSFGFLKQENVQPTEPSANTPEQSVEQPPKNPEPTKESSSSKTETENEKDNEKGNEKGNENKDKDEPKKNEQFPRPEHLFVTACLAYFLYLIYPDTRSWFASEISWKDFIGLVEQGKIESLDFHNNRVKINLVDKSSANDFVLYTGSAQTFENKLEQLQASLDIKKDDYIPVSHHTKNSWFLSYGLPLIIVFGALLLLRRALSDSLGGIISRDIVTKKYNKQSKVNVSFKDVAGLDEAKVEIQEFVSFLKDPKKYHDLGAKIPRGAILEGPPGTGKTLLAKAIAGESGVPFFSVSGSDFMEMFVGVGPKRVRGLFEEARKEKKAIIFVDEIDAIGRKRGTGSLNGNDERENTLNQLLVEMDGFKTTEGVIVLAGTNRPDVLDKALLRPGRFDRRITIDLPDIKSREDIFKVHLQPLKFEKKEEELPSFAAKLAPLTPGFSGADIAAMCNESALIAARKGHSSVLWSDFESGLERVMAGLEKRNRVLSDTEKKTIAFHEAGHAIAGWFLRHCPEVLKITIIPRGNSSLGHAQYLPKEQYLQTLDQLNDTICMALGGRVAEELKFGTFTTGAQDDLQRVTKLAYSQITRYGLNDRIGPISYHQDSSSAYRIGKPYSEDTAEAIDEEVRKIIDSAYQRTKKLLQGKLEILEQLATRLIEKELIYRDEIESILGKREFEPEPHLPPVVISTDVDPTPLPNTISTN